MLRLQLFELGTEKGLGFGCERIEGALGRTVRNDGHYTCSSAGSFQARCHHLRRGDNPNAQSSKRRSNTIGGRYQGYARSHSCRADFEDRSPRPRDCWHRARGFVAGSWIFSVALDNAEFNRAFIRTPNRTPFFYLNSSALSEPLKERQKLVRCSRRRSLGLGSNRS